MRSSRRPSGSIAPGLWPNRYAVALSQLLLADEVEPAAMLITLGVRVRLGIASVDRDTAYQVGRAAQAVAALAHGGMSSRAGVALVDAHDLLIAGGDQTAAARCRAAARPGDVLHPELDESDSAGVVATVRRMIVTHADSTKRELLLLPSPAVEWQGEKRRGP